MKRLDTSDLVDYEKGVDSAKSHFHRKEHESMAASTGSLFELAFGGPGLEWLTVDPPGIAGVGGRPGPLGARRLRGCTDPGGVTAGRRADSDRRSAGCGGGPEPGATFIAGAEHVERVGGLAVENHRTK